MGGKSQRAEKGHYEVWELYLQLQKDAGKFARGLSRTYYIEEIQKVTEYVPQTIGRILNRFTKNPPHVFCF